MNTHLAKLRLEPGHIITLLTLFAQFIALVAVITYRIGAVERRLEVMDERLWEHAQQRTAVTFAPDVLRVTPMRRVTP